MGGQDTTTSAQGYIRNVYTAMNALLLSGTQWDWAYWTPAKKDGFDGINLSIVDQNFKIRSNYIVWPYVQVCYTLGPDANKFSGPARL